LNKEQKGRQLYSPTTMTGLAGFDLGLGCPELSYVSLRIFRRFKCRLVCRSSGISDYYLLLRFLAITRGSAIQQHH